MHASNPSARLVSARPAIPPMPQNAPFCPTPAPPPATNYNCDATDNLTTRHPHLATLSAKQAPAIDLLLRGHSDVFVCAKLGMDRKTLYRWKHHHPAFIAELNLRQQQLLQQAVFSYGRSLQRSFKVVNSVLRKPDSPDALRTALSLINGAAGRRALAQPIGPTDPISVVNAMAAEEERQHTNVDPYVHQDMADRLAQLDKLP